MCNVDIGEPSSRAKTTHFSFRFPSNFEIECLDIVTSVDSTTAHGNRADRGEQKRKHHKQHQHSGKAARDNAGSTEHNMEESTTTC